MCTYVYIEVYTYMCIFFIYIYETSKPNDNQMGQTTCKDPFDYHWISYKSRTIAYIFFISASVNNHIKSEAPQPEAMEKDSLLPA